VVVETELVTGRRRVPELGQRGRGPSPFPREAVAVDRPRTRRPLLQQDLRGRPGREVATGGSLRIGRAELEVAQRGAAVAVGDLAIIALLRRARVLLLVVRTGRNAPHTRIRRPKPRRGAATGAIAGRPACCSCFSPRSSWGRVSSV